MIGMIMVRIFRGLVDSCTLMALFMGLTLSAAAVSLPAADIVYRNGSIYTVDSERTWAQALAVKNGKFVYVGKNQGVKKHIGAYTKLVDLKGAFVMPGVHDLHVHPLRSEEDILFGCNLPRFASVAKIVETVGACANSNSSGEWIFGSQWSGKVIYSHKGAPIKALLDKVSGDKAVVLIDDTHHNVIVNSKALELAGVTRDTADPKGGTIQRDPDTGEPTGLLIEKAVALVKDLLPEKTLAQRIKTVRSVSERMNSYGIIGWKDARVDQKKAEAYYLADQAGGLTSYVGTSLLVTGIEDIETVLAWRKAYATDHINTSFVKIGLDGVPPAKTAYMLKPYVADSNHGGDWHGEPNFSQQELDDLVTRLDREGFTVKIHATGDGSTRMVLDAVAAARKANGNSGLRHESSHASYIDPADIPRFKALGVAAEFAPIIWHPSPVVSVMVGAIGERGKEFWPIKDLQDAGTFMIAGSDWATIVPSPSPWAGVEAMITRKHPRGEVPGALWPEQAIDLASAIKIYTINGAQAMLLKDVTGSIEEGKSADFIVLDRNLFDVAPSAISETQVLETVFRGRSVFSKNK